MVSSGVGSRNPALARPIGTVVPGVYESAGHTNYFHWGSGTKWWHRYLTRPFTVKYEIYGGGVLSVVIVKFPHIIMDANLHIASRVLGVSRERHCKNNCPWSVSFKLYKSVDSLLTCKAKINVMYCGDGFAYCKYTIIVVAIDTFFDISYIHIMNM